MNLIDYGWDEHFESHYEKTDRALTPARITADFGRAVKAVTEAEELTVDRRLDGPECCVGDFICLGYDEANRLYTIEEVLERKTKFSRAAAGPVLKEQVVAANMDTVFIMQSLNHDFNIRRLERYLVSAWESGAEPVVVLSKRDLCEDVDTKMSEVFSAAPGIAIYAVSAVTGDSLPEIEKYFTKGRTVAILGSSGVGKSTLINALAGAEIMKTKEVLRTDDRGRHTTTHRELVLLPGGGVVMDTPGMRTLGLWEADTGMDNLFGDIEELAEKCRFRDCSHISEPGCAVRQALERGTLDEARWLRYKKLEKELAHIERRKTQKAKMHEKQFSKMVKSKDKEVW